MEELRGNKGDPEKKVVHMSQAGFSPFKEWRINAMSLRKIESICIRHLNLTA